MDNAQKLEILELLNKRRKLACITKKFQVNKKRLNTVPLNFGNPTKVCKISREGNK